MDLIKIGPNISYCSFSDQVNFMSFSLLRAFIQFNSNNKSQIMNDKEKDEGIKIPSIMDMMLEMLRPDKIDSLRYDIEDTILALLIQLVRDEMDYKVKLATNKKFFLIAA